ncbi:MAG: hypothetical protein ABII82_03875 [Verrucomicrobiota bacterium]
MRHALLSTALLTTTLVSVSAADFTARGTYTWTENLTRASGPADYRDAASYGAELTFGTVRSLESGFLLRPQLYASYTTTPEYDLLNSGELGSRLVVQRKFGLGPTAPVVAVDATVGGRLGRLDGADALVTQAGVTLSKRFSPYAAVDLRGEIGRDWAREEVYEVTNRDLIATIALDPHPRLRFTTGAGRRWGTFLATASAARFAGALAGGLGPRVANYYAGSPQAADGIFGPGWISYRVRGEADFFFFDLSPVISDQTSVSIRYERVKSVNIVDVDYYQDIFRVALMHAF